MVNILWNECLNSILTVQNLIIYIFNKLLYLAALT
jgi:hypothetical protein